MGTNELISEVIAYNADAEDSHYDGCYQRHAGCLAVMLRESAVLDAATEAKQPEGWSTEDRQESKQEAERRWVDERSGYKSDYNRGCINGFILGAEWQKARETFISYRALYLEAQQRIAELEAGRDAATAAVERVRAIHERESVNSNYGGTHDICLACERPWPCPTIAALDGAPEPEANIEYGVLTPEREVWHVTDDLDEARTVAKDNPGDSVEYRHRFGPWLPVEGEADGA